MKAFIATVLVLLSANVLHAADGVVGTVRRNNILVQGYSFEGDRILGNVLRSEGTSTRQGDKLIDESSISDSFYEIHEGALRGRSSSRVTISEYSESSFSDLSKNIRKFTVTIDGETRMFSVNPGDSRFKFPFVSTKTSRVFYFEIDEQTYTRTLDKATTEPK